MPNSWFRTNCKIVALNALPVNRLLLAGFDMNEILLAVKHARLWTASSKSKTQSSSSPIRSSAGKSAGMIHRKLARIMSTTCSPLNASNKSLRRGSLIASRVDELVDDAENRWAADPRANKAPPCGRRRRGSMNTARVSGSGDDSMPLVRERVMRRCSSEMNLSNRNDRREQHRWDESIASRRPGFWSSTKDSCVLSPKPALRRGSVQTHSQWNETKRYGNEDAEAPATTEADMLHYYQYGEATAQRDSVAENPTRATRQWSLKSNQQRGVGATQGGDVTPRPRSRRVSMDTGDAPSAPARRRSSFFGANGVSSENRDIQPSPTQRRSSICNDDPFQTQECQGSGTIDGNNRVEIDSGNSSTRIHRGPIRRISIIPLSWGLKSERDDTESMAGSISSTPSDIRRASNRTSVSGLFLGPVLSLDHGYAPDIDLLAVDLPHRSLFGGSHTSGTSEMEPTLNDVTIALRPRRRASMQELGPGHPSKQSSRFRDSSLLSSSTSSSGSQVSRRASFFGSILPLRDVLSGSVP